MPVKVKVTSRFEWLQWSAISAFFARTWVRIVLAVILLVCCVALGIFAHFYSKYTRIVDDRIRRPIFNEPAQIYAAPDRLDVGDKWSTSAILTNLRAAGYVPRGSSEESKVGTYSSRGSTLQIEPGVASYHPGQNATVLIKDGSIASITGPKGETLTSYDLEPQLLTGLFDAKQRSKRRLLTFAEIPPVVTQAIVSIEDRRFFEHGGINYVRLVEGLMAPILRHHRIQGGSTLTMQMARSFFLSNERSVRRKLAEMMIALILERRFTKEQILEIYVNQVDLGQHGSFNIRGFGEAAQAYFNKDIRSLTLPEAALLAGVVNGPTYFSPFHYPARALRRRNLVLDAMYENHVINKQTLASAKATPLKLAPPGVQADDAPYYVDLVRDRLLAQYDEAELNNRGMRVYTSLDRQLQRVASEAVDSGLRQVDQVIIRRRTHKIRQGKGKSATVRTEVTPGPLPQVALIALDPHTGEVLALVGGRDYSVSQLDHAAAKRPTGSIFKPFVYAAAINTALTGDPSKAITQITPIDATEGTFGTDSNGKPYTPHNFDPKDSVGQVTTRYALAHSINTATIRVALMVGLDKVVDLAKAAGIQGLRATPSVAIGSYAATPLEMAGAYTIFSNAGVLRPPTFIRKIIGGEDNETDDTADVNAGGEAANPKQPPNVIDPRVAYVLTDMMQAVLDGGSGSSVRSRFSLPAAGKTGTSYDAWFAGYTSNLLCVIWVGYDQWEDIKIEGGKAAAPIWTNFMVGASKLRRYHDMQSFTPPPGVIPVQLDKISNLPANQTCPDDYQAYFIDGTIPAATCDQPDGPSRNFFQKMFGIGVHRELVLPPVTPPNAVPNAPTATTPATPGAQPGTSTSAPTTTAAPETKEKKKGFWHRLFGGGKKDKSTDSTDTQP
ncbi:MAG TPA: transglycosylase domain-containing protein [Bryobacteraceae bacterium]|nr:transglycosylase domain-containing protein [Bryobacteraceae bacterium]